MINRAAFFSYKCRLCLVLLFPGFLPVYHYIIKKPPLFKCLFMKGVIGGNKTRSRDRNEVNPKS